MFKVHEKNIKPGQNKLQIVGIIKILQFIEILLVIKERTTEYNVLISVTLSFSDQCIVLSVASSGRLCPDFAVHVDEM